ncbi:MAG: PAS domain S-box protein [Anaerolineales bacterium]|nr:PAS domain S-box protein [Anaerolineales bacterium]
MSELIEDQHNLEAMQQRHARIDALNEAARRVRLHDVQQSLALSQEAHELATAVPPYKKGIAQALLSIGQCSVRLAAYDRAQAELLQALALFQALRLPGEEAYTWTGLGLIHWRLADYPTAVEYHLRSLRIFRAQGDRNGEAQALTNLGLVYGVTEKHEATLETYTQLLQLYRASGNRLQEGYTRNNLAMAWWQLQEMPKAQAEIEHSLQIAREMDSPALLVAALDTAGTIYVSAGDVAGGLASFQRSAALADTHGYYHDRLTALLNMGRAHVRLGQGEEALAAWHQALTLATQVGGRDEMRRCHEQLAQYYKEQGDAAAALAHFEAFHALDREIYNETADLRMKTLQVIYETETARDKNLALEQEIAERKRVEAALRASQESLNTLIEASPDAIFFKDGEGRWLIANQAGLRLFGLESVAYQGQTDAELAVHTPGYQAALLYCMKTDEATWRAGQMTRVIELIPHPDGAESIFDVIKVPLFTPDGQRRGLVVLGRDVTAQQQAEQALRQSESEYKSLYHMVRMMCDNVPDLIWAKDLDGRFLFTNQAICDKLLIAADTTEPIGKSDLFFATRERESHADNREWHTFGEICIDSDAVVLQNKAAQRFDEFGNVQGEFLYLDVYKAPFWDEAGEVIGTVGCGRVVTAEKVQAAEHERMAIALRESEERLRLMVQHMPVMIDAFDDNWNVVFWNKECERVTGYTAAEMIDNPQAMLLLYPDPVYLEQMKAAWIRQGNAYRDWEWQITCRDGSVKTIAWSNISARFPLPGWYAWGIGVDVTERQRAAEALRQAQKTESLGVLAGGIAHDFNNLLVAMLGQLTLALAKLPLENQARPHVEKGVRAAERAADLTQKMLAYSGRGHFTVLPLNLNALITENLHLFRTGLPKNVELQSRLSPALPPIEADPGQMQQVVMNLIINGAEAIGDRPGRVLVVTGTEAIEQAQQQGSDYTYTGQVLRAGEYVTLEIHDDGMGMEPDTLSKIFDPFFTTKQTGHGLGLAAVLGIVRGHQGGIQVATQPGAGTTFKLLFPASTAVLEEGSGGKTAVSTHKASQPVVLVIDDEAPVREALVDILSLDDIRTLTAVDGQAGLDLYQAHRDEIALVILDLSMPGLSGEETFRRLRQIDPGVRVLLSSGYSQVEVASRLDEEPTAFIQKPYNATRLLQTVGNLLK